MYKRILITVIVCLGMLGLPLGGVQPIQNVSAEEQGPPTLSSEGFLPPQAVYEPTIFGAPATDDYLPGLVTPAWQEQSDLAELPAPQGNLETDSAQRGSIQACDSVIWDNGPLVTHPGGGYSGNDLSVLQTSLGLNTDGFGHSHATPNRVTEEFTLSGPEDWTIESLTFFAYQTSTYTYPPASTLTGVYVRILDGPPNNPASNLVFGDTATNRMTSTSWTNIYRAIDTNSSDATRPIMAANVAVGISLSPGTYWIDWSVSGSVSSGPWAPPITILGQTVTGNAMQTTDNGTTWEPALDTGAGTQQGLPFLVRGCPSTGWLWNQPSSSVAAYVDQEFPDNSTFSSYLADDFVVQKTWAIDRIYFPGGGWNGFSSLFNATTLNWRIYADAGGIPAGYPPGAGSTPIWSLSAAPSDPRVTIFNGAYGNPSDTLLSLSTPVVLPPGHYWILFYPIMNYASGGQFGLLPSDAGNGYVAKFINPSNGFGYGTSWIDWTALGVIYPDLAFSIGGEVVGTWKSIAPIISTGRGRTAAATVNGAIFLIGGEFSGSGRASTVERYDPKTNTWTTMLGTMPVPASNICAVAIGTDIYIPGGFDVSSVYLNTLQVYHTTSDTWSTITTDPLPTALLGSGCAAMNGLLYVFGGGTTGGYYTNAAHVYDPSAPAGSRWSTLPSMNFSRGFLAGVTVNGKIYAVGGRDSISSNFDTIEAYNPVDNAWHIVTPMQTARAAPGAYAVGQYLYVCGGGWSSFYKTCEVYDTSIGYSGVWKSLPAMMLQGRRTFAYTSIGPVLYAIAGYNGSFLNTAERWSYDIYIPELRK